MTYLSKGKGILIKKNTINLIDKTDGIVFDCDGVLIDVSKSYDLAIKQTTKFVLKQFVNLNSIPITPTIISGFKATGGFNDEVDVTYASIVSLVAADLLGINPQKFINVVINNANSTGIVSIEKFLDTLSVDLTEIRKKLDYPGPHATNPLYKIFDQMFYGAKLYKKIFNKQSAFSQRGLIENDIVIVSKKLLERLNAKFQNKIAIVTGRGKQSTMYSLNQLFDRFNVAASVFLEDKPRRLAKPNPKSLIMSINSMNSKCVVYVGDSMEDLLMAKKTKNFGKKTIFCGIYGTAANPIEKKKLFEKNKADLILESINLLPKALNLAN
ncbi:HAD family hydrolase [Candidatus Nitrosotenuis cloacae]|uniref:Phosphatase n=1 Tax=Candidatus Nitrosotenuis cloacae TaxID=1603555 RepID=A0A3G1B299_9ARCH|nr:HAD family hydrolase [Candidatus Nitrosotenuis cloacae]AJZ75764.1 phosphatase [Candidatus Nitrosotenuis cloacae]